jgi:hypothetical protein
MQALASPDQVSRPAGPACAPGQAGTKGRDSTGGCSVVARQPIALCETQPVRWAELRAAPRSGSGGIRGHLGHE